MGETENSGNTEDSGTTEGETPEEGDDSETNPEEDLPPAQEQPADDVADPTDPSTEEEVSSETPVESEEESSDKNLADSVINSAGNSESVITYKSVDAADKDKGADTAAVEWKQGCVNGDKLVNGKDLRFTVSPAAGRSVTKVEITIDGKTETLTADAASGIYKVDNAKFSKKETVEGNETIKALSAEITITTAAQTYTITFEDADDALVGSYEIYTVTEKSAEDKTKVLDTQVSAPVESAAFDTAVEYAVVIPGTANKFVEITVEDSEVQTAKTELHKKGEEASAAKTPCYTFSLKPSDYVAVGDEGFTVKVKAVKKAELTAEITAGDSFSVDAPDTTGENVIPYVKANSNFGSPIVEGTDKLGEKKLAFKVAPATDYKITGVTAKAVSGETETTLPVERGTVDKTTGAEEDTIALKPLESFSADTEITITVATEYSNDKNVHAFSFKAAAGKDLDHVSLALTDGTSPVTIKDNTASVIGDTAKVTVSPDTGYELAKATEEDAQDNAGLSENDPYITIIRNKSYPAVTEGDTLPAATGKEEKKVKVTFDATGAAEAVTVSMADGQDAGYDGAAQDAADRGYSVTSVEVVIDASLAKNDEEKLVFFDDQLEDGYAVTTEGVIRDETADDDENTWVIPEGTDALTFTVTTTSTPAVTCAGYEEEIEAVSAEGGVYTYTIPTKAMDASEGAATILIDEAPIVKHNVSVALDTVSNVKSVVAEIDGTAGAEYVFGENSSEGNGSYMVTSAAEEGKELVLEFTPVEGAKITKLSYTMGAGEDAAEGEGTVETDGTASLTIDAVKGDVSVSVESASDYTVVLTGDGISGKDGAYKADYTAKNITVTLVKTGTAYQQRFFDIVVKDGSDVASTDAVLAADGTSATIAEIAKNEYGKTLTIEVYTEKDKKYTATLETTAYSEAVTVTRVDTGKAVKETDTVGIMADSKMEFTVTPAAGAALDDLAVEILSTKEGAVDADNTAAAALLETNFSGGKLTLQAKPAAEAKGQVLVSIYNKNEEADKDGKKPHKTLTGGKFILDLGEPVVKTNEIKKVTAAVASATNREVRLNLNVEFTNKKNPPAKPVVGALYYKVEIEAPTGAPKEVTPIAKTTKYVKITDFSNPAVMLPINLVASNSEDKEGIEADIAAVISSSAKVSLVQSLSAKDLETEAVDEKTDFVAGSEEKTATAALATKMPVYETKLAVKAVNGAAVFTGQKDAKVATPTFTKETSYDSVRVQLVNSKTGVALSGESTGVGDKVSDNYSSHGSVSAWVAEDNSIHVGAASNCYVNDNKYAADYYKNLGVKVIAVGPDDSYRASAVVKLKVQQGIYGIAFDESKATLPETLFKESDKKTASVKMTVQLNNGSKERKPAKTTVTWSVAPFKGDSASAYAKAAVEGKKPLVSVKNGTLTVSKDYRIQENSNDNKFTVTVKAADFARTEEEDKSISRIFEIVSVKNTIAKVVVLDGDNKILSSPLSAEAFDEPVYVAAISSAAKEPKKGQTYQDSDFLPVSFKSSAKAAVDVVKDESTNKGVLLFHKPGTKIKITASTVDGGKVQKMDALFDVTGYNELGLWLRDTEEKVNNPSATALTYSGGSNQKYSLYLSHKNGKTWEHDTDYKSVKVAVKGGKFIAYKDWAKSSETNYLGYVVVASDLKTGKAEITLTDTAAKDPATKKNKTYTYTITNTNNKIADKAPGIKMIDPKKPAAGAQTLTWQITAKDKNNYAGSYVMLAPDYSVTASNWASGIVDGSGTIRKIDENGQFTLDNAYLSAGGSYKLIATVGELKGGAFTTTAKDTKLSFSVPKAKKFDTNLKVTASYTLDPQSAALAKIVVKTDSSYTVSDAMNVIKKAKDQEKNVHTNNFTSYFEVKGNRDEYGLKNLSNSGETYAYIGLKDTLSAAQIAEIIDKTKKDDCTGYITVDNGYYRKDIQIKISFKTLKYTATGASVFEGKTAVSPVVQIMNGKTPVKAAFAKLDPESAKDFAASAAATAEGTVAITSQATTAAGKYDVKLLVVPEDSRYIKKDGQDKWVFINKEDGASSKPLTEDELYAFAVPVTAKIDVKPLDTKKVVNIKSLNVTLNTNSYTAENGNGYVLGDAGKMGNYVVDIPYTLVAGNTEIDAAADAVTVNLVDRDGKDLNVVGSDKTNTVVKASKQTVTVKGAAKNVIRLEVSKKALTDLSKMDSKDKPVTKYGGKLAVPVVIKYTNGVKSETVKFNITMPKKAPKSFDDVEKDIKAAGLDKAQSGNATSADSLLSELIAKVVGKAEAVVAADTDILVAKTLVKKDWGEEKDPAPETDDDAADVINSGKAVITLTLTNNAEADSTKKTKTVPVTCTFGIKHSAGDLDTVAGMITNGVSGIQVNNDTTADSLRESIEQIKDGSVTVGDYISKDGKGNLSLKVTDFRLEPATAKGDGTVTATIVIRDMLLSSYNNKNEKEVSFNATIDHLKNISEIKDAVETATNSAALAAIVAECSGQDTLIKQAVLAAAKKAAEGNPDIEVGFAQKDGKEDYTYVAISEEEEPTEPGGGSSKAAKDGSVTYTLVVKNKMTGRTMKCAEATAALLAANKDKYVTLDKAAELVEAAVVDKENSNTALLALVGTSNDSDTIKNAVKNAADGELAKVLGYECEWKALDEETVDFTYTPADSTNDGKLKFTLVVKSENEFADAKTEVALAETKVQDKDDKFQSAAELKAAVEAMPATLEVEESVATAEQSTNAVAAIQDEVTKLVKAGASLSPTVSLTEGEEDETKNSAWTKAADTAGTATLTNVKVTIDAKTVVLIPQFSFTVKAADTPDADA